MISIGLIIGIALLILSPRLCRDSKIASLIFVVINLLHELISYSHTDLLYYGGSALSQLLIITITNITIQPTKLALRLQYLCLLSIMIDFAGWVAWYNYFNHGAYNVAFYCIYAIAATTLLTGDTGNGKRTNNNTGRSRIRSNFHRFVLRSDKRESTI